MAFGDSKASNLIAVGSTDARSVRLWCRTERAGRFRLHLRAAGPAPALDRTVTFDVPGERDNTVGLAYPDGFPGEPPLAPLTRYLASIAADDGTIVVGEATFETAPLTPGDTPERFSIGVLSCHQPFDARSGLVREENLALLRQLPAAFQRYNTKFLMMLGDQMYADEPPPFSPFDPGYAARVGPGAGSDVFTWSAEEVRAALQERYRTFWEPIAWRKLMGMAATYSILDDHECFDDWGSLPAAEEARRQSFVRGARLAYMDYQGSKQGPWDGVDLAPAFDHEVRYGTVAGFVFDLRSERSRPRARVLSDQQLERFRAFLARSTDAHVLLLATSVPFVHIPEWVTRVGQAAFADVDFPDHWNAAHNLPDRARVLALLREHLDRPETARQKVLILGGDVHIGAAFVLRLVGGGRPIYQLTSSAVSNPLLGKVAKLIPERLLTPQGPALFQSFSRTADGTLEIKLLEPRHGGPGQNPCADLNAGVIEVERRGDSSQLRLKLLGQGPTGAVEVFESALL